MFVQLLAWRVRRALAVCAAVLGLPAPCLCALRLAAHIVSDLCWGGFVRRIPKEKYFPVPGVDGALVTFKLLPPAQRLHVPDERGFVSTVRHRVDRGACMVQAHVRSLKTLHIPLC